MLAQVAFIQQQAGIINDAAVWVAADTVDEARHDQGLPQIVAGRLQRLPVCLGKAPQQGAGPVKIKAGLPLRLNGLQVSGVGLLQKLLPQCLQGLGAHHQAIQ